MTDRDRPIKHALDVRQSLDLDSQRVERPDNIARHTGIRVSHCNQHLIRSSYLHYSNEIFTSTKYRNVVDSSPQFDRVIIDKPDRPELVGWISDHVADNHFTRVARAVD